MARRKLERDLTLMQMETLRIRFHQPKQMGDRTLCALQALHHSFTLATFMNPSFPSDKSGQEVFPIPVPLWALQHVVNLYTDYLDAGSARTLGEVFGLEGGGQGRRSAKDKLQTRRVQLTLTRLVYARRAELLERGRRKDAVLDPDVFADVSIATGYSVDSIRAAWKKFHTIVKAQGALGGKNLAK